MSRDKYVNCVKCGLLFKKKRMFGVAFFASPDHRFAYDNVQPLCEDCFTGVSGILRGGYPIGSETSYLQGKLDAKRPLIDIRRSRWFPTLSGIKKPDYRSLGMLCVGISLLIAAIGMWIHNKLVITGTILFIFCLLCGYAGIELYKKK